jgi:hypothetical protein
MGNVKPISPREAISSKQQAFPDFVIEVVNNLIRQKVNGKRPITVLQSDISSGIRARSNGKWEDWWLDFEDIYRDQGWTVEYDRPGYNESYPATFKFTPK